MRFIEEYGLEAVAQEATDSNLVELVCSRANEKPDHTAYIFLQDGENESDRLTFAELDQRARTIAAQLQSMGMTGERALLLYPPGLDYISGFFGCLYAGVIAVPANPPARRQKSRLMSVINDAVPAVIMTTKDLAAKYRHEFEDAAEYQHDGLNLNSSNSSPENETKQGLVWLATDKSIDALPDDWVKPVLDSDSLAFLQYTSGSTGNPKGVMVSHGNLMANQEAIKQSFGHNEQTTVVGWLPLYHDMGLIGNLLQPLYLGSTSILMPPMAFLEKPIRWLKAISNYQANTSGGPNFAYELCQRKVTVEQLQDLDLTNWSLAFNGSEPVRNTTMERFAAKFADCGFRRESFFPCYGLAEATLFVAGERWRTPEHAQGLEKNQEICHVACGPASVGHEIRIVDPETGNFCQEGCIGEIWVAGPSIAQGYWNDPEQSEQTFRARISGVLDIERPLIGNHSPDCDNQLQTFLRTGDLGFFDNSQLYITGRLKDLIIIRGRNVYPQDIEQALTEAIPVFIPDACAAFSVNCEDEEQLVVVAEITRAAIRLGDFETIASTVREILAEVLELSAAELVLVAPGTVPKTSSGKIRRQACKQMYLENSLPVVVRSGPSTVSHVVADEPASLKAESRFSPSLELQILQQSLSAVPKEQRTSLIAHFLVHKIALLLKIEGTILSTDSSLRSLGLDSLKAVELKHAVDNLLGADAPLSWFLSDESLGEIAEKLSASTELTVHAAPSVAIQQDISNSLGNIALSSTQLSMWTMQQLEPNSIVYNLHLALRITGKLDVRLLRQVFHYLSKRHAQLCTVYRADDQDQLMQQVLFSSASADFFTVVDASQWTEAQLQDDMARRAKASFNLETGPLLRSTCYEHGVLVAPNAPLSSPEDNQQSGAAETVHTLLICAHHIAVDLWSVLILVNELKNIYSDLSAGLEPQSPHLDASYSDFVAWQRMYLKSPAHNKDWQYWQRQLTGELPLLALPTDHPRPKVLDYSGASVAFRLLPEQTEQLKQLARQQGVTLFALLLTAYKVLLHRYTHQNDLIVGVPCSGRSQSQFTPVVGNFVNPLPLRSHPVGNKVFLDYLADVNDALLTALDHQDFPFHLMVERLQPERVADHWPIYQTLFVLQQTQTGIDTNLAQLALGENTVPLLWDDWTIQALALDQRVENFDLKLMAAESEDGLLFSFQYRRDLWRVESINRLVSHLETLLNGIIANPKQRLAELPLLTGAECKQILDIWNATSADYPEYCCLHELFEAQALAAPQATAVVCGEQRLSYLELDTHAKYLADYLGAQGVKPEMRIGLCFERSVAALVAILAVLKSGAAYVFFDPSYPNERIADTLKDCNAALLLTQEKLLGKLMLSNINILCLDRDWRQITEQTGQRQGRTADAVQPSNAAYLIYTSGSTGKPKGVVVSHANAVASTSARGKFYPETVRGFLLLSSFAFDSSVAGIFWTLSQGGCLCIPAEGDHQDPVVLAETIQRECLSHLLCLPSMYGLLLEGAKTEQLQDLTTVIVAGEACSPALRLEHFQRLPETRLYNEYGPTEATVWSSVYEIQKTDAECGLPVFIGRPIANTRIYLLNSHLNPVPIGVAGELYIGGTGIARNYHNLPETTAERFMPDPFGDESGARLYRTGDWVRWSSDGYLEFLGRVDHQVKIRGFRIELSEIELVLLQHPDVKAAVVTVREDGPGNKYLTAYWVSHPKSAPTTADLQNFLKAYLPDYMIPAAFMALTALPLTGNGKLDRKALPAPDFSQQFANQYLAPRDEVEKGLVRIWSDVLRLEKIGIHDNFFALGGDSILAIQAAGRARQAGLAFMPRQLFELQTIARLAEAIAQVKTERLEQENTNGDIPLTPIQQWFFEQNFANPDYWNQALLLEIKTPLDASIVEQALAYLLNHHDALRLRFTYKNGSWNQAGWPPGEYAFFQRLAMAGIADADRAAFIMNECNRCQAGLDLSKGYLLKAIWFDQTDHHNARLFIVIHHLAVDGVSWRILLEDLQNVYGQLSKGEAATLPAKTTTFKYWAEQLNAFAQSETLQNEARYWLNHAAQAVMPLPLDFPDGSRLEGDAANCTVALSTADTQVLLHGALPAYHSSVDDLLLVALTLALSDWCDSDSVLFDREAHGREALFDNVDLSLTTGWFTSVYPLRLELPKNVTISRAIKSIKQQLAHIPGKGIGYGLLRYGALPNISEQLAAAPKAQLLFNYLGRFDEAFSHAPWQIAAEPHGANRAPDNVRAYALEVIAYVSQEQLHVDWHYDNGSFREDTIVRLSESFIETLQDLINHCLSPQAGGLIPADFPLADLDQQTLDTLPYAVRNIEDIYPLSPMQEGMLFDTLMTPLSGIYLMQDRFVVRGLVDEKLFQQAWQGVINNHAALRTSFLWNTSSRPVQIVHRHVDLAFEYHDWQLLNIAQQKKRLDDLLTNERQQGFDFLNPPLMTVRLFRLAKDQYCFVRSYHHILIDAWCMSLMLVELLANYQALAEGRALNQHQAPPFRDYIAWLQRRDNAAASQFWRHYLRGISEATPFNVDKLLLAADSTDASVGDAIVYLSEHDTQKLNAIAQQYRLTPNTFVQAAWALMLSRYSGRQEVVFGITVSGRPTELPGSEQMLGLFINTLPLRVGINTQQSVAEFLNGLLQQNIELRQYEYAPLVQVQSCSEIPREQPLFESLLVFENYPVDPGLRSNDNLLNIVGIETRTHTNYPLNGMAIPGDSLQLQITYHKNRFDAAVVERMLGHFRNLLMAMVNTPDKRIGEISMLAEEERQLTLVQWNRTAHAYPLPRDIVMQFESEAERNPNTIAVACQGKQLTYQELNNRVNCVAHALVAEGIGPETLIAIFNDRGIDFLVMMLSVFKTGGAYLPLDPSHPDGRIAQVLKESGVEWILTDAVYLERTLRLTSMAAHGEVTGSGVMATRPTPTAPSLNLQQLCFQANVLMLDELEASENRMDNPLQQHREDNLAFVIFTSGSTGMPKGAMVEYKGMFNNLITKVPTLELTANDVIAQTAGQCFDISVWQHLTALACGARVEIFPDEIVKEPNQLLAQLAKCSVTILEAVPSMIQALLDIADDALSLPGLRWLIACGEAFPPELCRRWQVRFPGIRILNAYGPAECSDDVSYYEVPAVPGESEAIVPIGRPVHNTQLYLLDQQLEPVAIGVPGEICVAGIQVGRGYLNRPDLTAEKFIPDPFDDSGARLYRTGDLGRYRQDGSIEFLGRIDHQVKIRGVRIEPGEIEAQLLTFPKLEQALVMVREDAASGKRLVAYVVHGEAETGNTSQLIGELREHLSVRLPNAMMPSAFVVLDTMPLSANGKIDRKALPGPDMAIQSDRVYIAPRSPAEEILVDIWKEVLVLERVGVVDNFFDLGGHSLLAIQVLARIRRAFGVEVPLRQLFEASTIEVLAQLVETLLIEHLHSLSEEEAEALLNDA